MNKRILIGGILGAVALVLVGVWLFSGGPKATDDVVNTLLPEDDATDVVRDFYEAWLETALSTTTDPYQSGLLDEMQFSDAERERIKTVKNAPDGQLDPILCYEKIIPGTFKTKTVFALDDSAQVLVLLRDGDPTVRQALVTLGVREGEWQIESIECKQGESAPEREFSFEKDGNLLKNVPPPFNSEYWHIVFEENGMKGHAAPLFFDETSVCVAADGTEGPCDPNTFSPAGAVTVKGEMSEAGVNVKRLELRE